MAPCVTDPLSWELLVKEGVGRFGGLDSLVNNAGVMRRARIEDETAESFERTWRVNTLGPFLTSMVV